MKITITRLPNAFHAKPSFVGAVGNRLQETILQLSGYLLLALGGGVLAYPTEGATMSSGMQTDTVDIYFDAYGVPYIFGSSDRAAYYGAGYMAARDRLFQMCFVRWEMRGELAEFFGEESAARRADGSEVSEMLDGSINRQWIKSDKRVRKLG